MELNANLDIFEIKKFLSNYGWNLEGLNGYTDKTVREFYNGYIEKSNVLLQNTSYIMKLLGLNTHNFFETRDRINGNSSSARKFFKKYTEMINFEKNNYLDQLKGPNVDIKTKGLIDKAQQMFENLGIKEYISVYMVEKLQKRGLDINFAKSGAINNNNFLEEYSIINTEKELYFDSALYKIDLTKEITNLNTQSNTIDDSIFTSNKSKFIYALGKPANTINPFHVNTNSSDSMANLIMNNLSYNKTKVTDRVVALMTTLKIMKCLSHDSIINAKNAINELEDELARNMLALKSSRHIEDLNIQASKNAQKILNNMLISKSEVAKNLSKLYGIDAKFIKGKTFEDMLIECGFNAAKPISVEDILREQKALRSSKVKRETTTEAVEPEVVELPKEEKTSTDEKSTVKEETVAEETVTEKTADEKVEKKPDEKSAKAQNTETIKKTRTSTKPRTSSEQKEAMSILNKMILINDLRQDEQKCLLDLIINSKAKYNMNNPNGNYSEFLNDQINAFTLEISKFVKNVRFQVNNIIEPSRKVQNSVSMEDYLEAYPYKKSKALSLNNYYMNKIKKNQITAPDALLAIEILDNALEYSKAYQEAKSELEDIENLAYKKIDTQSL